jgi:hypothetical protein
LALGPAQQSHRPLLQPGPSIRFEFMGSARRPGPI